MMDDVKLTVDTLRYCEESGARCGECPSGVDEKGIPICHSQAHIADLIESLAAELEQAQSMLETRTRERDAAVEDLKRADMWSCEHCKFNRIPAPCGETDMDCAECKLVNCICKDCIDNSNWQWRGMEHGLHHQH